MSRASTWLLTRCQFGIGSLSLLPNWQLTRGRGRQPVAVQHPLNRAQARGRVIIAVAPLAVDGACSHRRKPQARLSTIHQLLAQADKAFALNVDYAENVQKIVIEV